MIRIRTIVVGSMLASLAAVPTVLWATSACQIPNPSLTACADTPAGTVFLCANQLEKDCGTSTVSIINDFPDGSVGSSSGTTVEDPAECIRTQSCVWNGDTKICDAAPFGPWTNNPKTVSGSAACPTDEGG